ncbi:MAG: hypothetical protein J6386_11870 [Candidatus Synoicihabitans palmerolidicus]|nr:hypothetical protein [Candidatus Synoicihabitans palmerolidicus]
MLTLNGGLSSIRFAWFEPGASQPSCSGRIDRIGLTGTNLVSVDAAGVVASPVRLKASDHRTAAEFLIRWLEQEPYCSSLRAVGHRVVHGMHHTAPVRVTPKYLAELPRITP